MKQQIPGAPAYFGASEAMAWESGCRSGLELAIKMLRERGHETQAAVLEADLEGEL